MAKIRIGFGSDFVLENSEVGIGTTNPTAKLQVAGTLKGDFNVSGISTLTVYGGFVGQNQNISLASTTGFSTTGVGTFTQPYETDTGYTSLVGEYNTVSEDLIVDEGKIFEISTTNIIGITTLGTQTVYTSNSSVVSVGTLESVSIQSHFSFPDGGINDRPDQPTEGMVRFNDDLNTLEFYNGIEWRQFTVSGASGRGVFGGGDTPTRVSTIDYINISSTGNAVNFGNLTQSRSDLASGVCASSIRGIFAHGSAPPTSYNIIDYVTIASEGNAIDFGDSTQTTTSTASCSSSTRGLFAGVTNTIDYITIATIGNALDFGDLSQTRSTFSACSSSTRGVFGGGASPTFVSTIDFVTIASTGNAVDFGDLSQSVRAVASCSSSTRGLFAGGNTSPGVYPALIDFITISSTGNAVKFGDLTAGIWFAGSCSSNIRGVFGGGSAGPAVTNIISYVTIATTGNAQDFGDLTQARNAPQGTSDSHGGLGGF